MVINDMTFVSSRKRLVGVCLCALPYRQEDMRFYMAFVSGRKRLAGVCFCALPYRQEEM